MKLRLTRTEVTDKYTMGKLEYLSWGEWVYFCDTLEDKVRDVNKNGVFDNGEVKVPSETAIPYGTYKITMDIQSPKFSNFVKYPYYKQFNGYLPRLLDVPNFSGILIHHGSTVKASAGCILVGERAGDGILKNSLSCVCKLINFHLLPAKERGEAITIEIA